MGRMESDVMQKAARMRRINYWQECSVTHHVVIQLIITEINSITVVTMFILHRHINHTHTSSCATTTNNITTITTLEVSVLIHQARWQNNDTSHLNTGIKSKVTGYSSCKHASPLLEIMSYGITQCYLLPEWSDNSRSKMWCPRKISWRYDLPFGHYG